MGVTHSKVTGRPNGPDPTKVGGVDWDADHTVGLVYRGYNVIGGTVFTWPASYYALAKKITLGSHDELLLSIEGYMDQTANNVGQYTANVWDDDAGSVGRLKASGVTAQTYFGGTGGGVGAYPPRWFGPGIAPVKLLANTTYWIGIGIDAGANGPRIYRDAGGHDLSVNQAGFYSSDGERWAQTDTTFELSIRALMLTL